MVAAEGSAEVYQRARCAGMNIAQASASRLATHGPPRWRNSADGASTTGGSAYSHAPAGRTRAVVAAADPRLREANGHATSPASRYGHAASGTVDARLLRRASARCSAQRLRATGGLSAQRT